MYPVFTPQRERLVSMKGYEGRRGGWIKEMRDGGREGGGREV